MFQLRSYAGHETYFKNNLQELVDGVMKYERGNPSRIEEISDQHDYASEFFGRFLAIFKAIFETQFGYQRLFLASS